MGLSPAGLRAAVLRHPPVLRSPRRVARGRAFLATAAAVPPAGLAAIARSCPQALLLSPEAALAPRLAFLTDEVGVAGGAAGAGALLAAAPAALLSCSVAALRSRRQLLVVELRMSPDQVAGPGAIGRRGRICARTHARARTHTDVHSRLRLLVPPAHANTHELRSLSLLASAPPSECSLSLAVSVPSPPDPPPAHHPPRIQNVHGSVSVSFSLCAA